MEGMLSKDRAAFLRLEGGLCSSGSRTVGVTGDACSWAALHGHQRYCQRRGAKLEVAVAELSCELRNPTAEDSGRTCPRQLLSALILAPSAAGRLPAQPELVAACLFEDRPPTAGVSQQGPGSAAAWLQPVHTSAVRWGGVAWKERAWRPRLHAWDQRVHWSRRGCAPGC